MGQKAAGSESVEDAGDAESGHRPDGSVWHALGLTVASVFVWGVAHLAAGRRLAGFLLMTLLATLICAAIAVRSYLVVRPHGLAGAPRVLAAGMGVVLVLGVCTPLAWAARDTYTLRDTIGTIFHGDDVQPPVVKNVADPWK